MHVFAYLLFADIAAPYKRDLQSVVNVWIEDDSPCWARPHLAFIPHSNTHLVGLACENEGNGIGVQIIISDSFYSLWFPIATSCYDLMPDNAGSPQHTLFSNQCTNVKHMA